MGPNRGSSVRRALALLEELGSADAVAHDGLGVTELAGRIGVDKSQVSRMLRTLADAGFADRDTKSALYRLGPRFMSIAARTAEARLLRAGEASLIQLVAELGERAHLSVLQGTQVLTLRTRSPAHGVQTAGWAGRLVMVHCTSSGRALLLDHDRGALESLLATSAWPVSGPNAPRNIDELRARIAVAREVGFALSDEESEPGLVAAAAPVRDLHGRIVAALNVSAPKFRLGHRLMAVGEAVSVAARELSRHLGWVDDAADIKALTQPTNLPRTAVR